MPTTPARRASITKLSSSASSTPSYRTSGITKAKNKVDKVAPIRLNLTLGSETLATSTPISDRTAIVKSNGRTTPNSGRSTPSTDKPSVRGKSATKSSRSTLTELSQNTDDSKDRESMPIDNTKGFIQGDQTLRLTPELLRRLDKEKKNLKDYVNSNLPESRVLEIVGWSKAKYIPNSVYDSLFTSEMKVKTLILRGRGEWITCRCPKSVNGGKLIDSTTKESITNIEQIYICRTFTISSCALLDLISRSPNLKIFRFYASLTLEDHHEIFRSVRFLCSLERIYWPWCNRKLHGPVLKTLVLRNDGISTFYSNYETTCDLISADLLQNLKYLSLIMNENWACKSGRTKKVKRYMSKLSLLAKLTEIEALEVRTFDIELEEDEGDAVMNETNMEVRNMFEGYQIAFWEVVAKYSKLKFLGIYGAWNLDEVARKISEHGLQIEYLRTNLMPASLIPAVDTREEFLTLSLADTVTQLMKLAKLKSIYFTCLENLGNIDSATVTAFTKLTDLIWRFEIRVCFTPEVEELLTNLLRRGNQKGKNWRIAMHIEPEDKDKAAIYTEVVEKFSVTRTIRDKLNESAQKFCKDRTGRSNIRTFHIWGLQQIGGALDKTLTDQMQTVWDFYEDIYRPVDAFL